MSVAFRRDGDEAHLEPKFEIPIPLGPNRVTARGLAQIAARVAEFEALVAAHMANGEGGDGDSPGLVQARRALRYWHTRQVTAEVAATPAGDVADLGVTVTFRHAGRTRTVTIVGDDEADPAAGLVAYAAPLARALTGAGPGDTVDFGGKADAIEIIALAVRDGAASS